LAEALFHAIAAKGTWQSARRAIQGRSAARVGTIKTATIRGGPVEWQGQ